MDTVDQNKGTVARCEYDQAIKALEYAVELNPCLAQTYWGLGDSLAYF